MVVCWACAPAQKRERAHCCWHVSVCDAPTILSWRMVVVLSAETTPEVDGHIAAVRLLGGQPVASSPAYKLAMLLSDNAPVYSWKSVQRSQQCGKAGLQVKQARKNGGMRAWPAHHRLARAHVHAPA